MARRQLERYPGVELVVQPRNLDTAPGILLPLARIQARDPSGRVAIFPSDHHLPRPVRFLEAVHRAGAVIRRDPRRVVLIGAVPDAPETEYGWIVPGRAFSCAAAERAHTVSRFVEKPNRAGAQRLLNDGALWNTFASVGRVGAYWALTRRHLPRHAEQFASYAAVADTCCADKVLEDIYARMAPTNFSRAILERAGSLAVVPVAGSGWSDWGSPERVFMSLGRGGDSRALLKRLRIDPEAACRPGPAARTRQLQDTQTFEFHPRMEPNKRTDLTERAGVR